MKPPGLHHTSTQSLSHSWLSGQLVNLDISPPSKDDRHPQHLNPTSEVGILLQILFLAVYILQLS